MTMQRKIRVMLAGAYPFPGGMTGTYGRILNNMKSSHVFQDQIQFIPLRVTLPAEGNLVNRLAKDMWRFTKTMRSKPAILHFLMHKYRALYREYPILKIAKALGVKTVVDIRAGTVQYMLQRKDHKLQNAMMNDLLRHSDAVILECRKDLGFIEERFGRKGLYLPNAVLEKDFKRILPSKLTFKKGQPVNLVYSGRYSKDKGVPVMLKSLDVLSKRGLKAELHLTGQSKDPEVADMIRVYVKNPPRGMRVTDHGWDVPDLLTLLASFHIFLMPTYWHGEGHPNSVTEAMMAGLGMILSDWLHRKDIVPDNGAIIVPPRNPVALAQAVIQYLNKPSLLLEAGQANRKFVKENFLDQVCYPRLLELYYKLLEH